MRRRSLGSRLLLGVLLTLIVIVVVAVALVFRLPYSDVATPQRASFDAAVIDKGAKLAAIGNCETCHTADNGARLAGGRAVDTPFGKIYSTNITPDRDTGIGTWSEAAFHRAMREGVGRSGEHLYPAFPYDHFTKLTDDDIKALYAYVMTRTPVHAAAPKNDLKFPFNVRELLVGWNLLYLDAGAYQPNPSKSAEWNRGAYLVEGLAHCGACHTPRNDFGAEKSDDKFGGGMADNWTAPALNAASPAPTPWDAEHFATYLRTGFDGRHGAPAGPMAEVVHNLSRADPADIKAMATYLADVVGPPSAARKAKAAALVAKIESAPPEPARDAGLSRGAVVYWGTCAQCHEPSRAGVPFALSSTFSLASPHNALHIIIDGIHPPAGEAGPIMPSFAGVLTDAQIVDLVKYARSSFSDKPPWANVEDEIRRIRNGDK